MSNVIEPNGIMHLHAPPFSFSHMQEEDSVKAFVFSLKQPAVLYYQQTWKVQFHHSFPYLFRLHFTMSKGAYSPVCLGLLFELTN